MGDAENIEFGEARFITLEWEGDLIKIAICDFPHGTQVGVGPTESEAVINLFHNAFPDKKLEFSPAAAMALAHGPRARKGQ